MLDYTTRDTDPQDKLQALSRTEFNIKNLLVILVIHLIIYKSITNVSYKLINSEVYNPEITFHDQSFYDNKKT